jgi:hypothetical protein
VITGGEIPPGPTEDGYAPSAYRIENILPEPLFVGKFRTFLVDSSINDAPDVLGY